MDSDMYSGCIVLLHYISQFTSRLGRPITQWDSKAFAATGDVVTSTVALAHLEQSYLKLLHHLVNVSRTYIINTALAAMHPTTLLDTVADGESGATAVQVRHTVYVPPLFVPILLAGELSLVEAW